MNDLTLTEKKKLVPKGKKLNPLKVKHRAEELLGGKFQRKLAEDLQCSDSLISLAFKGKSPFALLRINEHLKGIS